MVRKRLMRKRPALITASESISTLRANWPGSERPAAGQRLGHLMAVISLCRRVYFYSTWSFLQFNELRLVIRRAQADCAPVNPPHHHTGKTRED
ncbi:hypothetical protein NQZ68_002386 [Dissostichus eleginoides]|nr:hypothetical protein NQZ68_002386 [Dissostichus eleginoides]